MTRDEAYAKYGEAAWGMPQDAFGNLIAPFTAASSAPALAQGDWRSYADQYLGAMAGDVKTALGNINPNFDWSNAIKDAGTRYAALDGGLDPNRTPSTVLMQQIALAARDQNPQMPADYWNTIYNNLDPQRVSQAAAIQEWQSKQGDDFDLGSLLAIGGLGLGVSGLFGFNPFSGLGELFGGLGAEAGAAGEIAALTGSGIPVGGALGTGATAGLGGLGLGDLPWGVNPQGGGMDFFNTDSLWGNSGSGGVDNLFGDWNIPNGTFSTTGPASGAFPGYDFGLGYPVGGDLVTNLAGGGLTQTLQSLFGNVADKIPVSTLTKLLPSLLGMAGSAAQNKALEDIAGLQGSNRDQLLAFGAPYRQRLAGLYDNPSAYLNSPEVQIPVQQGTNAMARALSTQGNPIGNGTALQELQNYSANQLFGRLGQEKDRLAGFGGLTAYNQAGAQQFGNTQAQQALAQGQGNMWNALGYGLNQVFNPQPTLADLLKEFKGFNPTNSLPA